jgi:hypothetical protein
MAMQAAIKPRSFFEVSSITTSRVPWGRRAGADQDRGEHIVRTPTGEVEVYRDLTESPAGIAVSKVPAVPADSDLLAGFPAGDASFHLDLDTHGCRAGHKG